MSGGAVCLPASLPALPVHHHHQSVLTINTAPLRCAALQFAVFSAIIGLIGAVTFWPLTVYFPMRKGACCARYGCCCAQPPSPCPPPPSSHPPVRLPLLIAPTIAAPCALPQVYKTRGHTLLLMKVVGVSVFFVAVAATIASFQNMIVSWSTYSFFN